jgi:hypothetical protein
MLRQPTGGLSWPADADQALRRPLQIPGCSLSVPQRAIAAPQIGIDRTPLPRPFIVSELQCPARCWRPCPPTHEVVGLIRFARSMCPSRISARAHAAVRFGRETVSPVAPRSRPACVASCPGQIEGEISGGRHDDDHREQGLRRGRDAGRHRILGRVRSCDNASCGARAVRAATSRPRSGGSVLCAPRRGHGQGRARVKWPPGAPVPLTRPEA